MTESEEKPDSQERKIDTSPKVLVVDDDEPIRILNRRFLIEEGMQPDLISMAPSGEDALELLEAGERFDGIIMDNTMVGRKGKEVLAEIKSKYPDLFTVLSSGDSFSDEEIEEMKQLGVDLFAPKALGAQGIKQAIEAIKIHKEEQDLKKEQSDDI